MRGHPQTCRAAGRTAGRAPLPGWQISQPEGERGLLFTLPTCQAEDLGMLHLSAPDTGSTRRRRRLYESELRLYLSAPEEPSDT